MKSRSGYIRNAPVFAGLIIMFALGTAVGRWSVPPQAQSLPEALARIGLGSQARPADFSLLTETWDLIQKKYVGKPVPTDQLIRGAAAGLVSSLDDPYSFYLDPSDSSAFEDEINGKFSGIGAELGLKDNRIVIIAPLPESPAEKAGLKPGDRIESVDQTTTDGLILEDVVKMIRGPEGTSVALTIIRGQSEPQVVTITRQQITIKSVTYETKNVGQASVAIVKISSFSQSTSAEFQAVVQKIILADPAALILDLRNNPGGYLSDAVEIADIFLNDGPIVIEDFGGGRQEVTRAEPPAPLNGLKTIVLMNGGTASAAEILAGALADRLQVPTVGEQSFGKGSVQEIEDLKDGSSVKLTVAHWLTPSGHSIDKAGLKPSVPVDASKSKPGQDLIMDRALELAVTK